MPLLRRRLFAACCLGAFACTTDAPKGDDTGSFGGADGADGGAADGGAADGAGALSGDFAYGVDLGDGGRCMMNATVEGVRADLECPDCDFTLEQAYLVEFTDAAPSIEGICADTPYVSYIDYIDAAFLDEAAGIWGLGTQDGQDGLALAYRYGADPAAVEGYTIWFTDGSWDRESGDFAFSISPVTTYDYGYDGDAPPPPPEGYPVMLIVSGTAR